MQLSNDHDAINACIDKADKSLQSRETVIYFFLNLNSFFRYTI
jgi:hypothetical protein